MERLQRILSARGIASRRVAEEMIVAGRVSVNGETVTELGVKANPDSDVIRVDGHIIRPQRRRYVMLNKPRGFITTTSDERNRQTVMDLVNTRERLYPIGRLDRETEGLLLLTNDGELANRVMHPRFGLEKEYHILTPERPDPRVIERVRRGIEIDGKRVVPNEFRIFRELRDGVVLTISLHEGMFHVVRRIMDYAGIPVDRLTRVRIGPLSVAGLAVGIWRDLHTGEELTLFEAVHMDLPESEAATRRSSDLEVERARAPRTAGSGRPPRASERPQRESRHKQQRPGDERSDSHRGGKPPARREPRRFDPKRDPWRSDQQPVPAPPVEKKRPQRRPERPNRDFNPRDRDAQSPQRVTDHTGRPIHHRHQPPGDAPKPEKEGSNQEGPREFVNSRRERGNRKKDEQRVKRSPRQRDESRGVAPRNDRSKPRPPKGDRDRRPSRGGKDDRGPRSGEPDRRDAL